MVWKSGVLTVPEFVPFHIAGRRFEGFFRLPQNAGNVFGTEFEGGQAGRTAAGLAEGNIVDFLADPEIALGAGNLNQNRHELYPRLEV
jgi:hypothetical protein